MQGPFLRHIKSVALAVAVVLIATGCTIPLTNTTFTTPFFEQPPDRVLEQMEAAQGVENGTIHTESTVAVQFPGEGAMLSAALDVASATTMQNGATTGATGTITLSVDRISTLRVTASYRVVGTVLYFRVDSVPEEGLFGYDLSPYVGKWLRLDPTEIADTLMAGGDMSGGLMTGLTLPSGLFTVTKRQPDETVNGVSSYVYDASINPEPLLSFMANDETLGDVPGFEDAFAKVVDDVHQQLESVAIRLWIGKDAYQLMRLVAAGTVTKYGDMGAIGVDIHHDRISVTDPVTVTAPDESESIVDQILSAASGVPLMTGTGSASVTDDYKRVIDIRTIQTALELYFADHDAYPSSLDDLSEYLSDSSATRDPVSDELYSYEILDDGASYVLGTELVQGTDTYGPGSFSATPSGTEAQDVEVALDPTLDSDGDGLPDALEAVYGTDPQKPDSDDDGYDDGTEINNGYNPLGDGKASNVLGSSIIRLFAR